MKVPIEDKDVYFRLVIRIRSDAVGSIHHMGIKFGVAPEDASALLATARDLNLNVVGVSFHVGSPCIESQAYRRAIAAAKRVKAS